MRDSFELEAIHFLQQANLLPTENRVALLVQDIHLVAQESGKSHEGNAFLSAMELKRRIGGYGSTKSYLACLEAH